jgi:hypothetical protein
VDGLGRGSTRRPRPPRSAASPGSRYYARRLQDWGAAGAHAATGAAAVGLPFGATLKRFRLGAGLTQETLAERARLSARAVSDLERGVARAPRPGTLALLARALTPGARASGTSAKTSVRR